MNAGSSGTSNSLPSLDGNQHALRKAGEEFFEQFLEQARRGRSPLDADPRTRRRSDIESGDAADLETVGQILPYVFAAIYFASASARLVMAKVQLLLSFRGLSYLGPQDSCFCFKTNQTIKHRHHAYTNRAS